MGSTRFGRRTARATRARTTSGRRGEEAEEKDKDDDEEEEEEEEEESDEDEEGVFGDAWKEYLEEDELDKFEKRCESGELTMDETSDRDPATGEKYSEVKEQKANLPKDLESGVMIAIRDSTVWWRVLSSAWEALEDLWLGGEEWETESEEEEENENEEGGEGEKEEEKEEAQK